MATVFCFSSTGNSLYAAKGIAEKIGGEVVSMRRDSAVCADDVIGFVYPVYFWGLPRLAERFIAGLKIENREAYVFSVATHGGMAHGLHGLLERLLNPKGVSLHYGKNLKSVENYTPTYKVNDSETLRRKVDEGILQIADAVKGRERNKIYAPTFVNRLIYSFYPDENSDRFFSVAPSCTGCAICQKVCPADNIAMDSGKPGFSHKCENCLACLHNCPECAIDWKGKTEGKTRYRNTGISLDELISFNNS